MFSAAIIVFRESLEAFLIISIMVAATRGIARRGGWIAGGVLIGPPELPPPQALSSSVKAIAATARFDRRVSLRPADAPILATIAIP